MKGYYHTIIQEILALKQVDHPSIVNLLEVYKDHENIYLVMEKLEGVTLGYIMEREEKTTEKDTIRIVQQLLEVVTYLNNVSLAHCDIRPNNILINPSTLNLKIIDFGSSNYIFDSEMLKQKIREPLYAAPEMIRGHYGKECDIWSIGVIAFELLSGVLPFNQKK